MAKRIRSLDPKTLRMRRLAAEKKAKADNLALLASGCRCPEALDGEHVCASVEACEELGLIDSANELLIKILKTNS